MTDLMSDAIAAGGQNTAIDRTAALELDLEWAQRQRATAERREGFAEAARKAAVERADSAEQAVRALLAAHYIGPAADDEDLPCPEGSDLTAIAESLYEDWQAGCSLDDLDARTHVRNWMESK